MQAPSFSDRTLVIDSATGACSVALFSDDLLVDGDFRMLGRGHAEALVPMIARLPDRGRAARIAVALGPGSFTGVRVGLAAARALALAWGSELVGYPTLSLIAAIALHSEGAGDLAVATTGGHGEWFVQGFDAGGAPSRPLASLRPDTAAETTTEQLVVGDQAKALVGARKCGRAAAIWPDARAFLHLSRDALMTQAQPLYGRAPDAKLPAVQA
ncbi:tRNA threonylcarbamoyladenosine biosynthesis protein TsaB [Novosphingobium sp. Leaf2]|nr:tRNA threonylcarbamoyladenosine biosynthesis protein TsaB [Novosphingobium sp. Leaf2]